MKNELKTKNDNTKRRTSVGRMTSFVVLIFSLLLLNTHLMSAAKQEINKVFKALEKVDIKIVSGDCVVEKGKGTEIKVRLVHTYDQKDFKAIMKEEGNTLILKEEFPNGKSNLGNWLGGDRKSNSSWTVTVPEKTNINASTASGDVRLTGLSSTVTVKVASGDVRVTGLKGQIELKTASGDIRADQCTGDLSVKVASGDINLKGVSGNLKVSNAGGDIDLSDVVFTGAGEVKSIAGDVKVKLAKSPTADLKLATVSGELNLDYNGNPLKGQFNFSAMKGNISAPFNFDQGDGEQSYSPFIKRTFTKGGDSPVISMKTVSGELTLSK